MNLTLLTRAFMQPRRICVTSRSAGDLEQTENSTLSASKVYDSGAVLTRQF